LASRGDVIGVVKSERIRLSSEPAADTANTFPARVEACTYLGAMIQYHCVVNGEKLIASAPNRPDGMQFAPGAAVHASWMPADCLVLSSERKG